MTILIVHCFATRTQTEEILRTQSPESECVVLLHDFGITNLVTRPNTQILSIFDLLSEDEFLEVRDFSIEMIAKWFLSGDQNFSVWDGLSLGEALITGDTWGHLFPALRNHLIAHKVIQQSGAKEIYLGESSSLDKSLWQAAAQEYGVRVHLSVPPEQLSCNTTVTGQAIGEESTSFSLQQAKPLSIKWFLEKLKTVHQILCDGARICLARLRSQAVLVEDARPYWPNITPRDLRKAGIPAVALTGPLFNLLKKYYWRRHSIEINEHFTEKLNLVIAQIDRDPKFKFQGNTPSMALEIFFKDVFKNKFPPLAIEAMAIRSIVNWLKPALFLATFRGDATRRGRRWICKHLKIPNFVVMTETVFHRPEAPLFPADFLAALGPSTQDWALKKGLPADRFITLRRDTVDGYGYHVDHMRLRMESMNRSKIADKYQIPTEKKIIVYADQPFQLNDTGNTAFRRYKSFEILREAIRTFSDVNFVIKFHPVRAWTMGEGPDANSRFEDFLTDGSPGNVFFAPLESTFDEFLVLADILIGQPESFSCCEAIMVNKPTILLRPQKCQPFFKGFTPPDPASLAGCDAARYAADGGALIQHVTTYIENDLVRTESDKAASLALEQYIYAKEEGMGRVESVFHCLETLKAESQLENQEIETVNSANSSGEV